MNTKETKQEVTWEQLLKSAVEEPGLISQAYSTFHGYSIGNQMGVLWQCLINDVQPGPIAGYKKWKKLGRQVQKGSKALAIWIPIKWDAKVEDENGEETTEPRLTFKLRNCVFVYSQTDGDELEWPEVPGWDRTAALQALDLEEVAFTSTDGNSQGYARKGERIIAINPLTERPVKTWLHEAAHNLLGHTDHNNGDDRDLKEMEAEAVAMLVSEALGLDGIEYSRGYIQGWWGNGKEIPETSARRIFRVANKILEAGRTS